VCRPASVAVDLGLVSSTCLRSGHSPLCYPFVLLRVLLFSLVASWQFRFFAFLWFCFVFARHLPPRRQGAGIRYRLPPP